jgi:hypothetical protein
MNSSLPAPPIAHPSRPARPCSRRRSARRCGSRRSASSGRRRRARLVGVERVRVHHDELATAHQAEARADLVAELVLDLVAVDRQLQFLQRQNLHAGCCRLLGNVHELAWFERIRDILASGPSRSFHGLDLQQAWQGELAYATLLQMSFYDAGQFIKYCRHLLSCQLSILGDLVENSCLGVLFLDGCSLGRSRCWSLGFSGYSFFYSHARSLIVMMKVDSCVAPRQEGEPQDVFLHFECWRFAFHSRLSGALFI